MTGTELFRRNEVAASHDPGPAPIIRVSLTPDPGRGYVLYDWLGLGFTALMVSVATVAMFLTLTTK
jgi:hypothetical protein